MSFPIDARVVHLQLLVDRTAQRLWALNLHTNTHKQGDEMKLNRSSAESDNRLRAMFLFMTHWLRSKLTTSLFVLWAEQTSHESKNGTQRKNSNIVHNEREREKQRTRVDAYLHRRAHERWRPAEPLDTRCRKWVGRESRRTSYASRRSAPCWTDWPGISKIVSASVCYKYSSN